MVESLAELGLARRLAETALRTIAPGSQLMVRLDSCLPTALVVGQPELAARLIADVFGPLLELDPSDRAVLLETLDAWLEYGGSAGRAATRLYCHRNTVFNRLQPAGTPHVPFAVPAPGPDRDDPGPGRLPADTGVTNSQRFGPGRTITQRRAM